MVFLQAHNNPTGKYHLTDHIEYIIIYLRGNIAVTGVFLEIQFNNSKLKQLYVTGKSSRYKLKKHIIDLFFEVVATLEAAKVINDLWKEPSLHFEKLQGHTNRYSARLNIQYRLEMSIDWQNEIMTVGIIGLEDISNHYGG